MAMDLMRAFVDMADVLGLLPGVTEFATVNAPPIQEPLEKGRYRDECRRSRPQDPINDEPDLYLSLPAASSHRSPRC